MFSDVSVILSGLIGVFGAFAFQYLGYAGGFLVFLTLYVAGESFSSSSMA